MHADDTELRDYVLGIAGRGPALELERHVRACADCERRLIAEASWERVLCDVATGELRKKETSRRSLVTMLGGLAVAASLIGLLGLPRSAEADDRREASLSADAAVRDAAN